MSVYMNFDDEYFDRPDKYQEMYGVKHPYFAGIVLGTVFPIRFSNNVWSLKIAVFQSVQSFGYIQISADDPAMLPKIHSRGQIIHCKGSILFYLISIRYTVINN